MSDMMQGAGSNYDEICNVLEERLTPVFELLGDRLKGLEEENAELKDVVFKIVSGFGDAVNEHKKGGYQEMLASKHGSELDEISGPYSDLYGKDIKQELLDKLMGGEMGEDGIPEFVGGIKSKFDKLRSPAGDGSVAPREEAPAEGPPEAEEKPAEAPPAEEEEPPDMAGKMAKTLGLKMNSPKVPKFGK
jgi:hypothetical protein